MWLIFWIRRSEGGALGLEQAVLVLGLLNTLRFPLNLLALAMQSVNDCLVSTQRLGHYLLRETARPRSPEPAETATEVLVEEVICGWTATSHPDAFQLLLPRWAVPQGARVAILGAVGSGKSSLLAMLLGEMAMQKGSVALKGRVAFMAQSPWIQNASVRENILFGHPFKEEIYQQVLDAVVLRPDLDTWCDEDLTDIGERGINLSGGQKARVGLARCLYAAATDHVDTLLLDSPFAALDVITAQAVMEGLLQLTSSCTVLCTMSSHTHLLPHFSDVLIMEGGRMQASGTLADVKQHLSHLTYDTEPPEPKKAESSKPKEDPKPAGASAKKIMRSDQTRHTRPFSALGKFLGGSTSPRWGYLLAFPVLMIFLAGQICRAVVDMTLTQWAADLIDFTSPFIFMVALCLLLFLRIVSCSFLTQRATRLLHNSMFWRMLRAPVVSFFDVTTIGEICNKFSKDLDFADSQLPEFLTNLLSNSAQLAVIFVLAIVALPGFAGILLLMAFALLRVTRRSSSLLRALKGMEGATRSPIYSSFSETLAGLQTIRAWGLQERFRHEHLQRVKENGRFFFTAEMSSVWIMLRLELFTVVLIGSFSFMAVLFHGLQLHVDGPQIGIALVYAIQMTALFQRNAQLVMLVGQMLTACERVLSFEEVEQEPALVAPSDQDLMNWPEGSIEFEEVSMKYRDGDLVLKKASFTVDAGTRVGVCGRSGAGKSSLVAVLFRVVDPCHGAVRVDGVDIATLGLHTLRRNLSLIPQDPVIFSGSLRFNLDPFQQISEDEELLQALKKVGLVGLDLEMRIAEQGENLSQGQRQLLCIARVFAAPTRILVLDEATSAMDEQTDEFIKELLRTTWSEGHHTVLTIAHRLGTIIDYDKILVLASGEVAEFDTPQELRRRPKGHFAQMWREVMREKFETKASL
ncbi:Multidrug resistance-associated protein 1 (ATP-binding cassette sub-family C member 1) (Glutathione-S-conjugate-translocating ATPase ABCC1) (Leukotriene C(4) transporter) (LTC4 transporter) [Durusdinium trenchii]